MKKILKFWSENNLLTIICAVSFGFLGWLINPLFFIGVFFHLSLNIIPSEILK